jgi:hypothetical protein
MGLYCGGVTFYSTNIMSLTGQSRRDDIRFYPDNNDLKYSILPAWQGL